MPQYPPDAAAAGIQGVVLVEVVISEPGRSNMRRLFARFPCSMTQRCVPFALEIRPDDCQRTTVPVRMIVTVNFTPPK
jgi:hypothetical protein